MNKEIMVQVALKGAVELAVNDKIKVGDISSETNTLFQAMIRIVGEDKSSSSDYTSQAIQTGSGGSVPMTDKQEYLLNKLCEELNITENMSNYTLAQASAKITELKALQTSK